MFRKILVALDGSDHSFQALEAAAAIARADSAQLVGATVAYLPPMYRTDMNRELAESFRDSARMILADARKTLERTGFEADLRLLEDAHPAVAIAGLALREAFDLVVLGRRGLNPTEDRSLGGVSDAVLRRVDCSVMLVR